MEHSLTIYKASAGSGKTFALAVEYILGLLKEGKEREFEHTLAVTFTNKATAEMKNRILETLYGLKMGLKEARPYMDAIKKRLNETGTVPNEQQIQEQAGKALTAILHDYSRFRVETIDSFFQSILRNMARELGLAANLQVELSTDEIIDSAVDTLIETMDQRTGVKEWIMACVREQLENGEKWDIVKPLKAFAGNIFKEEYQRKSKEELEKISNADTVEDFKDKMFAIRNKAKAEAEKAANKVIHQIEHGLTFDIISNGKNLRNFLLDAREMKREGPSQTIQGQANGSKPLLLAAHKKDPNCQAAAEALLPVLSAFLDLYSKCHKKYVSANLALHNLGSLRLIASIDKCIREIEAETDCFSLSSTPALLSKMIANSDSPFIFEKVGTLFNNVMIDEFQDTSQMQWDNFKKLLFEKLASGEKGLLVGDIKQSIYRWRNGDWKILYGIEKEEELEHYHIKPKLLNTNYRSHGIIVDFNNAFFPKAATLLDSLWTDAPIKLSDIYEDVEQQKKEDDGLGYVRVKLFKGKEDCNERTVLDMIEQIRQLQKDGLDLSQIAILVRKNKYAQILINGFSQHASDIPLVSDEAFLLRASTSVQMIIAAMRMLVDKHHTDKISEKYLMLHYLQDVLEKEETTIQDVAQKGIGEVLPEEFTAHKDELLQMPLYLLTERLWRIFSLKNIKDEDIYVLTFFDVIQKHLRSAVAPDVQTFLSAWDEDLCKSSVPGSSAGGIRILTCHKAKGLEFHTVLLPFCDWEIEDVLQGEMFWCETTESPFNELGALPIPLLSKSKGILDSVFASNFEKEHLERRVDTLNLLYVAFTRATANLFIWGNTKANTVGAFIYNTLKNGNNDSDDDCFNFEIGKAFTKVKEESEKKENRLRLEHCTDKAIDVKVVTRDPMLYFLQSNQAEDYLKQRTTDDGQETTDIKLSQREIGKRMHEVLSRIDDVSQLEEVLGQARQEGIIGESEDWETICKRIEAGFKDSLVASWFNAGNTIYNECAIASIDKETGLPQVLRPDRVVMNGNDITVIDYKFGHPSPHYYAQVKDYMDLMKQMYPNYNVQGYIWYIMGKGPVMVKS